MQLPSGKLYRREKSQNRQLRPKATQLGLRSVVNLWQISSYCYKTLPALAIKTTAKISPKKAMWAMVLPPILNMPLLWTITPSITITPKRRTTTVNDIVRVVLNGETKTLEVELPEV